MQSEIRRQVDILFKQFYHKIASQLDHVPNQLHNALLQILGRAASILFNILKDQIDQAIKQYSSTNSYFIKQITKLNEQVESIEQMSKFKVDSQSQFVKLDESINPFRAKLLKNQSILNEWKVSAEMNEAKLYKAARQNISVSLKSPGKFYIPQIRTIIQPCQEGQGVFYFDLFTRGSNYIQLKATGDYDDDDHNHQSIRFTKHFGIVQLADTADSCFISGGSNAVNSYATTSYQISVSSDKTAKRVNIYQQKNMTNA